MSTSSRHLKGTAGVELTLYMGQIHVRNPLRGMGGDTLSPFIRDLESKKPHQVNEAVHSDHLNIGYSRGLGGALRSHEQSLLTSVSGGDRGVDGPAHGPYEAVQRQLSKEGRRLDLIGRYQPLQSKQGGGKDQVVARPRLVKVGGGEVRDEALLGPTIATGLEGRPYPMPGFTNAGRGEPRDVYPGQPVLSADLNLDQHTVDPK
jgi:hypothetical protein